jgi:hypothetical protein
MTRQYELCGYPMRDVVKDHVESIVRKYSSPRGEVFCRSEELVDEFLVLIGALEMERQNAEAQAEAWNHCVRKYSREKNWLERLFFHQATRSLVD